jgi:ATP-binding cassette subfamily C (CFTR/MRP) protein 4
MLLAQSPVIGHLNATVEGLTTIRASKAEQVLIDEFDRHQDLHASACYMFQCSMKAFTTALGTVCELFESVIVTRFLVFANGKSV